MCLTITSFCVCLWFLFLSVCDVSGAHHYSLAPSFINSRVCAPPLGDTCINIKKCRFFTDLLDKTPIPRPRSIIKIIVDHQCGMEEDHPKVCCFMNSGPPLTTLVTTPKPNNRPRNFEPAAYQPDFLENHRKMDQLANHPNFGLLPLDRCGPIGPHILSDRITFGKKTALEEFPWMALIAYQSADGIEFRCGGTIIHSNYVLTAAHCILNSTLLGVRLGEYDLNSTDVDCDGSYSPPPVQDFYISNTIIHPLYDAKTHAHDIALLRLAGNANFTYTNIQPICLPVSEVNDDLTGKFAVVAGWGITEYERMSTMPLKATLPVLPNAACKTIYDRYVPISENQICAGGYKGQDSCSGDSGGPLMYAGLIDGNPRYIQYGIVSFGPKKCGAEGQPGIYTRVKNYITWILDNLEAS